MSSTETLENPADSLTITKEKLKEWSASADPVIDAKRAIDAQGAEAAFEELQAKLAPYREKALKLQMLAAIEKDPHRTSLRVGKERCQASEIIFADATDVVQDLMLDALREASKGRDVRCLCARLFDEIASNYASEYVDAIQGDVN